MNKIITVIIVIGIAIVGIYLWWANGLKPANSLDTTQKIFTVQKGEGVREIANGLKQEGLIKDPIIFYLLVKELNLGNKIQVGDFKFSPSMSPKDIAQGLTQGMIDIWVTIPEGKRADEIADILKEKLSSYQESWRAQLETQEGYLFPDSYLFPREADINLIISTLKNNFDKKYASIPNGRNSNLSQQQIVTIASLVEREAKFAEDRPLVASVILNRINLGMALDIDATVQYALGFQPEEKTWWKKDLTADDLKISSPFNTYANPGLPPTPISNPGLDALKAVVDAPATAYLYYLSDKSGHNHYAKTFEEHAANIKKYGL